MERQVHFPAISRYFAETAEKRLMPSKKQLTHNESRYSENKSKMAACKSVVVLCPNARRQTIKVNPTTTVLQVLYCLHVFL